MRQKYQANALDIVMRIPVYPNEVHCSQIGLNGTQGLPCGHNILIAEDNGWITFESQRAKDITVNELRGAMA